MRFTTSILALAATLGVSSAVGFNSFNDPACNGFEEHYNLNPGAKGNLGECQYKIKRKFLLTVPPCYTASTRRSFRITNPQTGCHLKFYTGLNQAPNDASAISFTTETNDECYWTTDGRQFRSFGFYCP